MSSVATCPQKLVFPSASLLSKVGLVLVLVLPLYFSVLVALVGDWWNDEGASHGFLIPPLVAYIVWQRRHILAALPRRADGRGLLAIAAGCVLLLAGKLAVELFITRMSLVVLLAGLVWTFRGRAQLRALTFPFLLLATMVPIPAVVYNQLAGPLQLLASNIAASVAQALGVSVYRDGNIIYLAQTALGVAEACSGLRSLSSLGIAALMLGWLRCSRPAARILLFACSLPLAVFMNVLRVAGTAVLADYDQQLAVGFYHSFSGWLVFVSSLGILLLLAGGLHSLLERKMR